MLSRIVVRQLNERPTGTVSGAGVLSSWRGACLDTTDHINNKNRGMERVGPLCPQNIPYQPQRRRNSDDPHMTEESGN